jgi:hypothetical protein
MAREEATEERQPIFTAALGAWLVISSAWYFGHLTYLFYQDHGAALSRLLGSN